MRRGSGSMSVPLWPESANVSKPAPSCSARWTSATAARAELVACGYRPRRLAVTGVAALTGSERRVADLAARGLANRDIAQALFVAQRTVELHLTHAYQKLGITSRRE